MAQGKYINTTKKSKLGTILFYSFYGLFVVAAIVGILCLMDPLHDWLVKYQASQPETKSQEIFQQYFADPNWEELYTMAGIGDTKFEDKATFSAYMQERIGDDPLTCMETSAGLSGDRKYVIRHGTEKVASFLLKNKGEGTDRIVSWEFSSLELFYQKEVSVVIEKSAEEVVYINGIPLTEEYVVENVCTLAEDYLPDGVHGYRRETLVITDFLKKPDIVVKDADGNAVETKTDDKGVISTGYTPIAITDTEKEIAINAAKANALYAIRAVGRSELKKHFDETAQIYKDICETEVFMQKYTGHRFDETATSVTDYYRYSDDLFSARVCLNLKVTRTNGTVKTYEANTTYFFSKQSDGSYKVTDMTNIPIQEQIRQVRVSFIADGETLSSAFIDTNAKSITLPEITIPEGQQLRGWAKDDVDENGKHIRVIVFTPTETGVVTLAEDTQLESMTLYPVFEKKGA